MSSPAADLADYLADLAIGTIGADLFIAAEPATPANCTTVYDTGGPPSDVTANFYRPTIQVRVRDLSYVQAVARLAEIFEAFASVLTLQQGAAYYFGCGALGEPESLGRDDQNRFTIVQNFQILREVI